MAYNCFFGTELQAGRPAEHIPVPPQTSLVVSQVCVAAQSTYRGRMSVVVEGPKKTPITLATLHPEKGIFQVPLQVIFSNPPTFTLVVNRADVLNEKNHLALTPSASKSSDLESRCVVHMTGYYEREMDKFSEDDDDGDEEGDDDEEEWEEGDGNEDES